MFEAVLRGHNVYTLAIWDPATYIYPSLEQRFLQPTASSSFRPPVKDGMHGGDWGQSTSYHWLEVRTENGVLLCEAYQVVPQH